MLVFVQLENVLLGVAQVFTKLSNKHPPLKKFRSVSDSGRKLLQGLNRLIHKKNSNKEIIGQSAFFFLNLFTEFDINLNCSRFSRL